MLNDRSVWGRLGGRLPRRISLRVFISILIIEMIILVPSVLDFEKRHLDNLRQLAEAKANGSIAAALHRARDQQDGQVLGLDNTAAHSRNVRVLDELIVGSSVVGATLYSDDGDEDISTGVKPVYGKDEFVSFEDGRFAGPENYRKAYYEFKTQVRFADHTDTLVVRIHTNSLHTAKVNYILRISGLVLLIAVVVCGSTMYVLHTTIIRPLYRIRDHLDAVREDPERALDHKLGGSRDDEVGQVYQSIDNLLDRVAATYREEVGLLAGMIEESPLGAMAYDADGRLAYVNDACIEMWGGGGDNEAFAVNGPRFRNADFPNGATMPELLKVGAAPEVELIRADGDAISCILNAGRLRDADGAILRYHATISDVSKLRLLESRFRDAVESFKEGFGLFDKDDNLIVWNEPFAETARRTGLVADTNATYEYILRGAANFFMSGLNDALKEAWVADRLRRHKTRDENQFTVRVTDRTWLSVTETRTGDQGTVVVFSNITEVKLREKELSETVGKLQAARDEALRANKAKSTFLANMSHELRTPLNAVIGYSQLLKEDSDEDGDEGFVEDLSKIEGAGQHLLHLINNILDISKVEAGRMDLQAEEFTVDMVVDDTLAMVSPLLERNRNTLTVDVEPGLGGMFNDQTKLRQNLVNLVANAAKFTSDGDIRLEVAKLQENGVDMLRFVVSDTGIGMTADQLDKLFQPFVQADTSTTREYGGTGLGLAISKHYSELMGGRISATSKLNAGSRFEMIIPCVLEGVARDAPVAAASADAQGPRVLVVDDDPDFRAKSGDDLIKAGFEVIEARGGKEGLKRAKEDKPDVILLDIVMPDLEGWTVLKALKKDPETTNIPVILATIAGNEQLAATLGAEEVLAKPVETGELVTALGRHFGADVDGGVLIVDDDASTRAYLSRIVRREGIKVKEAADGKEAIAAFGHCSPRLILLDLLMPEMNGFELLDQLRKLDEAKDVPVIVLTSKDLSKSEASWLSDRVLRIFRKGDHSREDLIHVVKDVVDQTTPDETSDEG